MSTGCRPEIPIGVSNANFPFSANKYRKLTGSRPEIQLVFQTPFHIGVAWKCLLAFQTQFYPLGLRNTGWLPEVDRECQCAFQTSVAAFGLRIIGWVPEVDRKWNRLSCWRIRHSKIVKTSSFSFCAMCSFWSRRFRLIDIITIKNIFIWIFIFLF